MPLSHSSTLHPPRPSHHREHSHRETPGLCFRGGRILSTRKEAHKGVKAVESSGRPACVSWEGWRSWKPFPNRDSWKSWCIWIDLPVGAAMNKLGWIQGCANVCEPDKVSVANRHPLPPAQGPRAEFWSFAMNSVLDFKWTLKIWSTVFESSVVALQQQLSNPSFIY